MTPDNLAIVFGPTVLHPESQIQDIGLALRHIKISQAVVKLLILQYSRGNTEASTSSSASITNSPTDGITSGLDNLSVDAADATTPSALEKSISDRMSGDMKARYGEGEFKRGGRVSASKIN